jgi:type 1 fimbria pilin
VSFSGKTDSDNPTLLAITDTGKGKLLATGLGIELLDNSFKILPFDSVKPLIYELDGETNTLSFLMRYKSTKAVVTPGEASAVMYFDLTYQ